MRALLAVGALLLSGCGTPAPATFVGTTDGRQEYAFRAAQIATPAIPRTDEQIIADWAQRKGVCPGGYDVVSAVPIEPHRPYPFRAFDVVVRCKMNEK